MKENRIKKYFWAIAILSIVAAVAKFLSYGLISYIISTLTSVGIIFTLYKLASYFLEIFNKHIQDTEENYNKLNKDIVTQTNLVTKNLKSMESRMLDSTETSLNKVLQELTSVFNANIQSLSKQLKSTEESVTSKINNNATILKETYNTQTKQLSTTIQSLSKQLKSTEESVISKINGDIKNLNNNMYEILDELKKIDTAISLLKKPSTSNIAGKENPNRVETIVDKDTNYTLKNTYINNSLKKSDMLNGLKTVYTIEYDNEGKIEKCTNYDSNQNIQTETYYFKNGQVKQRKEYNKGKISVSDFSENGKKIN